VKSISGIIDEETCGVLKIFLENVIRYVALRYGNRDWTASVFRLGSPARVIGERV
jgi:hypothetical protein